MTDDSKPEPGGPALARTAARVADAVVPGLGTAATAVAHAVTGAAQTRRGEVDIGHRQGEAPVTQPKTEG